MMRRLMKVDVMCEQVEESKKAKPTGKVDPAIANALRSMKAAPKPAVTATSTSPSARKRPAPVAVPKRFLSAWYFPPL
jgi:hypothetical protein